MIGVEFCTCRHTEMKPEIDHAQFVDGLLSLVFVTEQNLLRFFQLASSDPIESPALHRDQSLIGLIRFVRGITAEQIRH